MLADSVEGAARALVEPTPSRIESLVEEIALKKLLDGQFDECHLTLEQLRTIEDSLIKSLTAVITAGSSIRAISGPPRAMHRRRSPFNPPQGGFHDRVQIQFARRIDAWNWMRRKRTPLSHRSCTMPACTRQRQRGRRQRPGDPRIEPPLS